MNPPPRASWRQYESIFDAVARVGVSTKTIRRWNASGHLAGDRMVPRLLRLDPDDLDELDKMLTVLGSTVTRRAPRAGVIDD